MNQGDKQPVVLAAGGTGGHIFPAEALAEVLLSRGERVVLVTDKRFANFKSGALSQIEKQTIHAGTIGGSVFKKIRDGANIALGIADARGVLKRLKPKIVVGFGGYPSFPTVFSAGSLGIPTIIHEQNSVLGRANRMLASRVDVIATSFPATRMMAEKNVGKIVFIGNPVRASIRALRDVPYPALTADGKMHILITGGSQGASIFSHVIPEAIAMLPSNLRARVRLDQQCREGELMEAKARYDAIGVNADLAHFFVDVPARLGASHLVIARSGASTITELAVAGRPAILVPLPGAMDNHQYYNAEAFEDTGGGWVMAQDGFTPASLSARLESFLTAPDSLAKAAQNAKKFGTVDAAEQLAGLVLEAAGVSSAPANPPSTIHTGRAA